MRVAPATIIDHDQRKILRQPARSQSLPTRVVERSQIVLLAASGLQDIQIAAILRITPQKVARWRERFQRLGLPGLLKDAPRPGRARTITRDIVQKVIDATLNENPANGDHWSGRSMAAAIGISEASVRRIWRAHGITPRLTEAAKLTKTALPIRNNSASQRLSPG